MSKGHGSRAIRSGRWEAAIANTKYQVNLSVDGKHSVSVQSDDPAAVTEGLLWAKKTWGQLLKLPGKPFQTLANDVADRDAESPRSSDNGDEAPICAVHDLPMVKVQGKRGEFWSCHQRNEDGGWCDYRPDRRS